MEISVKSTVIMTYFRTDIRFGWQGQCILIFPLFIIAECLPEPNIINFNHDVQNINDIVEKSKF